MSDLRIYSNQFYPIHCKVNRTSTNPNFKSKPVENPEIVEKLPQKTQVKNKKQKVLAGLAIVTVVGIVGVKSYRSYYINKAQRTFKEVFMRDNITKDETIKILKRYKEIEKIKDKEKYAKAVFEEAKKNFGFENKPISFMIKDLPDSKAWGGCSKFNDFIETDLKKGNREGLLEHIHHEFRHAKQHEITFNQFPEYAEELFMKKFIFSDEFIEIGTDEMHKLSREWVLNGAKPDDGIYSRLKNEYKNEVQKLIKNYIGDLSPDNVPQKYKEFAKKCQENQRNYIDIDKDEEKYLKQFVEEDARTAAGKIAKLLKDFIIPV